MDFGLSFGRGAGKHAMQRGCVVQTQNLLSKTLENLGRVVELACRRIFFVTSTDFYPTVRHSSTAS